MRRAPLSRAARDDRRRTLLVGAAAPRRAGRGRRPAFRAPLAQYAVARLNVRFADPRDGWIYGGVPVAARAVGARTTRSRAVLWSTHDGGGRWRRSAARPRQSQDAIFDLEAAAAPPDLLAPNAQQRRHGGELPGRRATAGTLASAPAPRRPRPAAASSRARSSFAGASGLAGRGQRSRHDRQRPARRQRPLGELDAAVRLGRRQLRGPGRLDAARPRGGLRDGRLRLPALAIAPPGATLGSSWLYLSSDGGTSFGRAGPELDFGDAVRRSASLASPKPGAILLGRDGQSGAAS